VIRILLASLLFCLPAFGALGHVDGGFAQTEFTFEKSYPSIVTTDATQTVVFTHELPADGDTWKVTVTCHGSGTDDELFDKSVSVERTSGTAAQQGSIVNNFLQPSVNYDMTFDYSGASYRTLVTGAASDTVTWRCIESLRKFQ